MVRASLRPFTHTALERFDGNLSTASASPTLSNTPLLLFCLFRPGHPVFKTLVKGNSRFSRTVIESYSAALWNRNPTFMRSSFNSLSLISATSSPNTFNEPPSGTNNPTIHCMVTDLPMPERPRITTFSPRFTVTVISFNTSLLPNDFLRCAISITASFFFPLFDRFRYFHFYLLFFHLIYKIINWLSVQQ